MGNNPAIDDLEVLDNSSVEDNEKFSPVAEMANAIETILSEEHLNQKSNISYDNEQGLIEIDVLQSHFNKYYNRKLPSLIALSESKKEHVLSVGGYRSNQIVEIFKSIQTNIIASDMPVGNRLLGKR